MTEKFRKLNVPYFVDVRFVDSGVDCADASSASVAGRDAGVAGKESRDFKKARKVEEFDMSCPSTHPKQRLPESPATVSRIHVYFLFCTC
jgi:hypothetical protein